MIARSIVIREVGVQFSLVSLNQTRRNKKMKRIQTINKRTIAQKSADYIVGVAVRPYGERDLDQLIQVYKSAFAEPPWNEYMKCVSCGVEYGRRELDTRKEDCKKCNQPLNLVEFWSDAEIVGDLEFALVQPDSVVLVAENSDGIAGMTWGYKISFEKFPFLLGKISTESSYMDEIAVRGDNRLKGVGMLLGRAYIKAVRQQGLSEIVLRTDERNISSMSLFGKLGFSGIADSESSRGKVYDSQFPNRIYLRRRV